MSVVLLCLSISRVKTAMTEEIVKMSILKDLRYRMFDFPGYTEYFILLIS